MQQAERGVFDIRRGHPVHIRSPEGGVLTAPVEGLDATALDRLRQLTDETPRLVLTSHRARSSGLAPDCEASVSLPLDGQLSIEAIAGLCSGTDGAPGGLDDAGVRHADPLEQAALALVRAGRLIPAALVAATRPGAELAALIADGTILSVPAEQAAELASRPRLQVMYASEATVPLAGAEHSRFMLFREANGILEHIAVLIGEPGTWPDPVPARLHSACLTGDLFGSLRCDCGEQLRASVRGIAEAGGGVLLYLAQEGRGIGLANKLRAYQLQDQGMDTLDADCSLGFGADERRYEAAVEMLHHLEISRVRLFTNNPEKIRGLEAGGISVPLRESLHGKLNPHNRRYLSTKADRAGHWLQELLGKA